VYVRKLSVTPGGRNSGLKRRRIQNVKAQTGSRRFTWCGRDCSSLAPLQRRVTRSSPRASKSDERIASLRRMQVRPSARGCGFCNTVQYIVDIRIAKSNASYGILRPSLVLNSLL